MTNSTPKILIIAGTDPLSGAGLVADALNVQALGGFPMTLPTALVDQDSNGVYGFISVDLDHMERSLKRVLQDGRPDAIKVGMLGDPHMASLVFRQLQCYAAMVPIVLDPVLAGGGPAGGVLSQSPRGRKTNTLSDVLSAVLRPGVLVTPNALELGTLMDTAPPVTTAQLEAITQELADESGAFVLGKGGHTDAPGTDIFVADGVTTHLTSQQPWTTDLHGTGCLLSTAIAVGLAEGRPALDAVRRAKRYLEARVISGTIQIGRGRAQILAGASAQR